MPISSVENSQKKPLTYWFSAAEMPLATRPNSVAANRARKDGFEIVSNISRKIVPSVSFRAAGGARRCGMCPCVPSDMTSMAIRITIAAHRP